MEIQIPSFAYNKVLNSPEAGKTISEATDFLQPSLDIGRLIWPIFSGGGTGTTFATSSNLCSIPSGPGIYEMYINFVATILNGVNAGLVTWLIQTDLGDGEWLSDTLVLARLAATELWKSNHISYKKLLNLNVVTPPADNFLQLVGTGPAAATNINWALSVQLQRVG